VVEAKIDEVSSDEKVKAKVFSEDIFLER